MLLKLKPGVTEDQAQAIQDSIIDLPNIIPGVLKSSVGKDFGGRSKGFDIGKCPFFRCVICRYLTFHLLTSLGF